MNKTRGNKTHVLLAYEFISNGLFLFLLMYTPPPPPPLFDEICSIGEQNMEFLNAVELNTKFLEGMVVRFKARFSEGNKQKSKNFVRLLDS